MIIGHKRWIIPDGYIPPASTGNSGELINHDALCILNGGLQKAKGEVTIFLRTGSRPDLPLYCRSGEHPAFGL